MYFKLPTIGSNHTRACDCGLPKLGLGLVLFAAMSIAKSEREKSDDRNESVA